MKTLKFIVITAFTVLLGITSYAQTHDHSKMAVTKTDTIKVSGNCGMCKTRIEKAAKIEGVSKAEWNDETKMLTLVYDPAKVKTDDVLKKIAEVGHDTEKFKAEQKVYDKLPGCCQYR
ncbi:MAG TPA: ATPase [Marinilabiliales bacterium]|jgi:copper chaperone CopZ|nr:MAG: ATPase [Bacteroidetes bacterium GWA2_40_14]OFX59325.1 MAG: ATPase [Bacteroidetes bacterium GWC2_40_13]OFX74704.1 MAG: ATPase [Bacteroidetes bacterium GWD2_40_43]OFX88470.1 MAG: ATPase [Bacteroidetes bacterium GWE2_40_63]OFY22628.1 MAG: ATPase [Bacteroidetes bacterium GWF2_40_13]OFZ29558.1 MAG: ATPase [Bacteroidetes bacterium RIFOXYC2_FULL_40_12]HAN00218.1 ATPase [Marinilabiliales bacterium]